MMRLAEYQRREIEVRDTCALCGVTEMDPFVVERVGVWAQGAQLRVQATEDIRALVVSFEKHHGVPRVPFVEQQWRVWLGRHKPWSTVCVRCAAETGVQPLPLPEDEDVEEPQRALPSESGNGTLSPVASDSGSPSPRSPDSARRDDHSRYRGLPDVEVSPHHGRCSSTGQHKLADALKRGAWQSWPWSMLSCTKNQKRKRR